MKYEHGFYWPDTETHFIEYLNKSGGGEYQAVPKIALDITVNDWSCVIDIGAHVGTWSKWFASKADQVHSFEPVKTNFSCLQRNLRGFSNCTMYNNAVSDNDKYITMWKPADLSNTGQFSSVPLPGWEELRYQARAIDNLNLEPTVIKIDIQGGEYPALKGCKKTIEKHKPVLCWENSKENVDKQNIYEFLTDLGYRGVFQYKEDAIWVHSSYQLTQEQQDKLNILFRENRKKFPVKTVTT